MASVFLCYSRRNLEVVRELARDLEGAGHRVWFDQELTGGQNWWDHILAEIRACDIFVLVLSPETQDSTACTREGIGANFCNLAVW